MTTPAEMHTTKPRWLTALPVYNERGHVSGVLNKVQRFSPEVLVVDDGSTDGTGELLAERRQIRVARHPENRGYGAALITAFDYAAEHQFDILVTIDCDGQHEPRRIPEFVEACRDVDIVSGSRYLKQYDDDMPPPERRRQINAQLTAELNKCLGLNLTDAFCGFKAYRVAALKQLELREPGYGMPLELWAQAVAHKLRIVELPVPLIYLEEERSFGGSLDNGETRLRYYHEVLQRSLKAAGLSVPANIDSTRGGSA